MGAFSPVPDVDVAGIVERVHQPVLDELFRRGTPFVGCLFAGLMLTPEPKVLEFNARFGDPETQALMPRVQGDLLEALFACAGGDLGGVGATLADDAAVTVVLAGPDYPARSDYAGAAITGIEAAEQDGALVFHGGTAVQGAQLVTNGGRILSVTGTGTTLEAAHARAYAGVERISFAGAQYRRDIAAAAHA
jgi:phosphoribosylamine--glycine ligase